MSFSEKKKRKIWLWLAVERFSKQVVDFELGCRGIRTLNRLWQRVSLLEAKTLSSDHWQAYKAVLPADRHVATKAETYTVESKNAQIRHYLARCKRKSFCYSKSLEMLKLSLALLFQKLSFA
ncbi:MAG: IS1 family transposase [Vampirovibrionales bacterium]|nr:IS1 family transposase [Vampirovibrionales bacterium]